MKRRFASIASLAFLFICAGAHAQEFKFATQNPKGHPITNCMEKVAELVAAKSGGKIKINQCPGGVLGGDAPNISAL